MDNVLLVDSHCHLDRLELSTYDGDLNRAIQAARDNGVGLMLNVSITLEKFPAVLAIARQHADIFATVGVHPNEREGQDPSVDELVALADDPKIIAIGETGLDYFRSEGDLTWQHERFRTHMRAAIAVNKPLVIHSREARQDTLALMREEGADAVGGIMHCFVEDWETARAAMDLGFYISFSGIVTFKNAVELKEVAKQVPAERILVETDAPYLAPVPHRGKPNQPAYVRYVAEHIAELRGVSFEELATTTTANFQRLFGLG